MVAEHGPTVRLAAQQHVVFVGEANSEERMLKEHHVTELRTHRDGGDWKDLGVEKTVENSQLQIRKKIGESVGVA